VIPFVKAHACGNDFLIIDEQYADPGRAETTRLLCHRNTGIGADGVEWLDTRGDIAKAILSNADGSIAEISGNGTRCVAAWLASEKNLTEVPIETGAGTKVCRILTRSGQFFQVETGMGQPQVSALQIAQFRGVRVSMGNPHFVLFVDEFPDDWIEVGASLSTAPEFPEGTNVEFVRITGTDSIEFRIYERGAGPTLSSGTGSCASGVAAMATQSMPRDLRVTALGGEQFVRWGNEVFLTGPAELIARGEAYL
jgi:diaminopimelate epimerase